MNPVDPARLSRAQGCLLGQLAGDSLGGLVEFSSAESLRRKYPDGVRDLRDGGVWRNLAGQPTDDSELALMLARTLAREKRFDRDAVFAGYRGWFNSGPFDIGNTIRAALGGGSPSATSQANGSLMRVSPLGIFGAGRPEQAAAWAREDSRLTHPHPVCQDACAVYVAAIAAAVAGATPQAAYDAALAEAGRSGAHPDVRSSLAAARLGPPTAFDGANQGWVLIALQNAFYQLLHAVNLEEGVVDTVQRGGDTDTNGAIAGALLGAAFGRPGVPSRWADALLTCRPRPGTKTAHPRPEDFWPCDALELAAALLEAGA
jgi:ADP-ribosylglycohydrolase